MKRDEALIIPLDKNEKRKIMAVAKSVNRSMSGLVRSIILDEYEKLIKANKVK